MSAKTNHPTLGRFFGKRKAYADFRYGANHWAGGAVIVRLADGAGYQAIPGAHLTDASYTGSRDVIKSSR